MQLNKRKSSSRIKTLTHTQKKIWMFPMVQQPIGKITSKGSQERVVNKYICMIVLVNESEKQGIEGTPTAIQRKMI